MNALMVGAAFFVSSYECSLPVTPERFFTALYRDNALLRLPYQGNPTALVSRFPLDYPVGGSGEIVQALVRGLRKHGGSLRLGSHVDQARA